MNDETEIRFLLEIDNDISISMLRDKINEFAKKVNGKLTHFYEIDPQVKVFLDKFDQEIKMILDE